MLIPTTPVAAEQSASSQAVLGVTLDGVRIDASAPVDAILGAYTIAAFDDCGGHFNPAEGYHLHGAVGCSEVGEAADGDTAQFGYALDGYAVHSPFEEGEAPDDLDAVQRPLHRGCRLPLPRQPRLREPGDRLPGRSDGRVRGRRWTSRRWRTARRRRLTEE